VQLLDGDICVHWTAARKKNVRYMHNRINIIYVYVVKTQLYTHIILILLFW